MRLLLPGVVAVFRARARLEPAEQKRLADDLKLRLGADIRFVIIPPELDLEEDPESAEDMHICAYLADAPCLACRKGCRK